MNKTSGQQMLQFQTFFYVPLFYLCDRKYIWHSTVLYQLVSLVTESIIMILHEPDVALQNWYAFILLPSHTPRTVLHCWYKGKTNLSACLDIRRQLAYKFLCLKGKIDQVLLGNLETSEFDLSTVSWSPMILYLTYIHAAHYCVSKLPGVIHSNFLKTN